jgi:asparagine synthase (glutamine-hydrolysing)
MIESIKYRGPDNTNYYTDPDIGLGHARLSILDPENGRQPMTNEDGSVVVIFNGEIFNYRCLRESLLVKGHVLDNNSDTVILPHLYEDAGLQMFEMLNGQFAIAIWDKKKKTLILARDRYGEKPLYYFSQGRTFCFASEAKAILKSGCVRAALSPAALKQVFTFWTTLGQESVFEDIRQVPSGSYLVYDSSGLHVTQYWSWTYGGSAGPASMSAEDYEKELERRLISSVKNRMISDVPISFYLSGGLDSSLITSIGARLTDQTLNTFSITFEESAYDESAYQELMSQYLGTAHQRVVFSQRQIPAIIREVVYHAEVPLMRSGAFPMYVLANLVRQNSFKVVLSGEGSDELFGGYDIFREVKIREFCRKNPEAIYRAALYSRVNNFAQGVSAQPSGTLSLFYNSVDEQSLFSSHSARWKLGAYSRQFFSREYREAMGRHNELESLEAILPPAYTDWTPVQKAQYLEVITLFSNYLLSSQGDRVSMGAGVECRYPFLDYEVYDLAAALPDSLKIRGLREKFIVKKLAQKYLPDRITKRKKYPYRAPINIPALMKDDYIRYITSDGCVKKFKVFEPAALEKFLQSLTSKEKPNERDGMLYMGILTTQILCENFIK